MDDDLSFLLQHVFVAQAGLTWRLAVDLLDKMNNPDNHHHYTEVDDDDLEVIPELIAQTFKKNSLPFPENNKEIKIDTNLNDPFIHELCVCTDKLKAAAHCHVC